MEIAGLNKRVVDAQNDERVLERFIEDYKPFILTELKKATRSSYTDVSHEYFDVALSGFYESIKKFDHQKGNFISYARFIMRKRLMSVSKIDNDRQNNIILWFSANEDFAENAPVNELYNISIQNYYESESVFTRKKEIEAFVAELAEWGLTLADVYKDSPKHESRRLRAREIIRAILNDEEVVQIIVNKMYLPISLISERYGFSKKDLEKLRRYIISCCIISIGDYLYLQEYIK